MVELMAAKLDMHLADPSVECLVVQWVQLMAAKTVE